MVFVSVFVFTGCTSDFDEINTKPDGFLKEEVSATYFITGPQVNLVAPNRYPYWRAHLIHADRFSGQVCFGHSKSWWSDVLGYKYSSGYTDATWGWMAGYLGGLNEFMKLVKKGGDYENEYMYAVGQIMKGFYFQMFTDTFGMVPYSEAGNPDIVLPKFDTQKEIYEGIIAELNQAMMTIGDAAKTGVGANDLADNDVFYQGDLQKWKKLANTLKLRIAMRALGADGADFAEAAIREAVKSPLLETEGDNCLLKKYDKSNQWGSAMYADIWHNFGAGSDWTISKELIDVLRDNNDPRLSKYAQPAKGGSVTFEKPEEGNLVGKHQMFVDFIKSTLTEAGVTFTETVEGDDTTLTVPGGKYIGQPVRLNGDVKSYVAYEFFSTPSEEVIQERGKGKIRPEIVMTTAEAYFLRAEAAVRGLSDENAQEMYTKGIEQAMKLWEVEAGGYLNLDIATLSGTLEEKVDKIAMQRWIASYTDGFEAWAIVRDYGVPKSLAEGVSNFDIFAAGDINGEYPTRMRYGNGAYNTNGDNLNNALGIQGADELNTPLWWAQK